MLGFMTLQTTKIEKPGDDRPETGFQQHGLRVGTVLWDRYEIQAVLGSSDLGELWRCHDREDHKDIALRWLPPDLRRSKPVLAVIHAGIRRISDQSHPNLAAIRQLVYVGDQIYLVGDYAPGMDIGSWYRQGEGGRRTLAEVLPVLKQAASALDFAHAHQIIHRNLKPSNLYLGDDGVVRVTDFGLAPHRHLTIVHGEAVRSGATGPYLAPEIRDGGTPDSASDQYALAVLACELLAGAQPQDGAAGLPGDLPSAAKSALRRALSAKARNRFVTCDDFVRALGGERVGGRRGRSPDEWRRLVRILSIVVALPLVAGGLWWGGQTLSAWLDAPRAAPPAARPTRLDIESAPVVEDVKPVYVPPAPLVATTPLPVPGQPWVAHTVPMEFVWVPAMQLWVGRYEVTNDEYMKKDPAHDSGEFNGICLKGSRQPVVRVNFDDTMAYAAWLTEQERAAGKLPDDLRYRLPARSEAIAYTRAGMAGTYPWGDIWPPVRGNYADTSLGTAFADKPTISGYQDGFATTAPVDMSGENPWGIYGAGGNVWETTSRGPGGEQFGGWQGGGWEDYQPVRLRSDALYGFIGNARGAVNGFRLVLAPIAGEGPPADAPPPAPAPAP
jgi:serine/threonine protein kinase/formylglycine-generating enzyme required for sulfatase activity